MRAVRERNRALCTLLDEQDRETTLADVGECLEDQVDHTRSEAERRLVEEQHLRIRNQRPRDRELLLLTARQRPGLSAAGFLDDGKQVVDLSHVLGDAVSTTPAGKPEPKILLDCQLGEDAPALPARARRRGGRCLRGAGRPRRSR